MSTERELQLGMKCVKYMIFVANVMFMLVGLLLISIGYTIRTIYTDFDAFLVGNFYKASDFAIVVGIIILLVALFGCVGAIRQSVCLVNMYALCLLLIVALEIGVSITAYSTRNQIEITLEQDMYASMDYFETRTNYIWSATQYSLQCCGVRGPSDWMIYDGRYNLSKVYFDDIFDSSSFTTGSEYLAVPRTCCLDEICASKQSIYFGGCVSRMYFIISQSALLLGVGAMCITIIQLLGAVFAHLLARSIRKLKSQIEVERTLRRQQLYEQLSKSNTQEKVSPVLYVPSSSEA